MNIELDVQTAEASAFVRAVWSDQLPWVTAKAINRTATDFQEAQRAHQATIFQLRRPEFVQRAVKIKPFANKQSLEARVSIDPPGGQKRADILTKFESDTEKTPFRGSRLAVPTENVPRVGGVIKRGWRPKDFKFQQHGEGKVFKSRGSVFIGKRSVFAILKPGGRGLILERDHGDVTLLYTLVPRVRIRPNLHFVMNAERTVNGRWVSNFDDVFGEVMRTTKGPEFGAPLRSIAGMLASA